MPSAPEDPLVKQAFSPDKHEELARAIKQLNPEEAAVFLHKLEMAIRKRKIQITGYLVAMVVWLVAMMLALVYFGTHTGFVGWIFLVPFGLVGAILYVFGHWAERVARMPLEATAAPPRAAAAAEPAPPAQSAELPRAEVRNPR